jgi:hypothetical protein
MIQPWRGRDRQEETRSEGRSVKDVVIYIMHSVVGLTSFSLCLKAVFLVL